MNRGLVGVNPEPPQVRLLRLVESSCLIYDLTSK